MPENSASYPGRPAPAADRPGARSPMQAPTAQAEVPHISPRGHGPERHACSARPCPGGRPSRQPYYLTSSIKQQVSFRPAMGEPAAQSLKPFPASQAPRSADPPGRAHEQPARTGLFLHARRDDFVCGQMEELVQRPARSSLRSTQAAPSPWPSAISFLIFSSVSLSCLLAILILTSKKTGSLCLLRRKPVEISITFEIYLYLFLISIFII